MNPKMKHAILKRSGLICLWVNVFLMVIKLFFGHIYLSKALFADGVHSLLDVSADLFMLYAVAMANLPRDERHSYGYSRYETLGNIVISLILILAAFAITIDAMQGLDVTYRMLDIRVSMIALVSMLLNEASYQYVRKQALSIQSDLLMSTAVHQRADAATSLVVFLAAVASYYHVMHADIVGAIFIAGLIMYYAVPSCLRSIQELLDRGLDQQLLERIKGAIVSVEGVRGHHLLRSRKMADKGYIDVHIVVSPQISVSEGHFVSEQVERKLLAIEGVMDVTVHVDYEDDEAFEYTLPSRDEIERWLSSFGVVPPRLVIHYEESGVILDIYDTNKVESLDKPAWLKDLRWYKSL